MRRRTRLVKSCVWMVVGLRFSQEKKYWHRFGIIPSTFMAREPIVQLLSSLGSEGHSINPAHAWLDKENQAEQVQLFNEVSEMINILPQDQSFLIRSCVLNGITIETNAQFFGKSPEEIQATINLGLGTVMQQLAEAHPDLFAQQ